MRDRNELTSAEEVALLAGFLLSLCAILPTAGVCLLIVLGEAMKW